MRDARFAAILHHMMIMYSAEDVSAKTGLSVADVNRAIKNGTLTAHQRTPRSKPAVFADDYEAWIRVLISRKDTRPEPDGGEEIIFWREFPGAVEVDIGSRMVKRTASGAQRRLNDMIETRRASYAGRTGGKGDFTTAEAIAVMAKQQGLCAYCYRCAEQLDHIVPPLAGGTNDIENLQWVCWPHNNSKMDIPDPVYRKMMNYPPKGRAPRDTCN